MRAYRILPESIVPLVGHLLPVLEIVVGLCLVLGLLTRVVAVLSALMLAAFIVGIASAWARGLQIECGCFGGGAGPGVNATAKYPWDIARDTGLLLLSALARVAPRGRRTPWTTRCYQRQPDRDERRQHQMAKKKSTATRRKESQAASARAAAIREAQEREERRRRSLIVTGIGTVVLALVLVSGTSSRASGTRPVSRPRRRRERSGTPCRWARPRPRSP